MFWWRNKKKYQYFLVVKSALSGAKSALSGAKSALSGAKSALSGDVILFQMRFPSGKWIHLKCCLHFFLPDRKLTIKQMKPSKKLGST